MTQTKMDEHYSLSETETKGKIVQVQAWKAGKLLAVFPAGRPTKRMSPTKIKNAKLWFKEHYGVFDKKEETVKIPIKGSDGKSFRFEEKVSYKEVEPYVEFKVIKIFN